MNKEEAPADTRNESNTNGDGAVLYDAVVHFFHSHFSEVLNILSSRFPHVKGDGSQNEIEFNGLRAKILRSGNNQIRRLETELMDYEIRKTQSTKVEVKVINTAVTVKEKGAGANG